MLGIITEMIFNKQLNFFKMEKTLGEKRVRTNFNVSQGETRSNIDLFKTKTAELINMLEDLKAEASDGEQFRLIAEAQTNYENAAMWAVKAVTF